jgi:hypothetical protein
VSDYEKMTGDKKISEIEELVDINGEEKVLVAHNGYNYVIPVAKLINEEHTHSYSQLTDLQELMNIIDAQYQHIKDSTLPTTNKEIVGAIGELYDNLVYLQEVLGGAWEEPINNLNNDLETLENNFNNHNHSINELVGTTEVINTLQSKVDNSLPTNSKEIVGAILEVYDALATLQDLVDKGAGGSGSSGESVDFVKAIIETTWASLRTTSKTLIGAINEVYDNSRNSIGNLSALQTTNKSDLVSALNELFQNANNGKQLIANVIGEPLNAESTFQAMSDDIDLLLTMFMNNMQDNGVEISPNDKFKTLIDKLQDLAEENESLRVSFANALKDKGVDVSDGDDLASLISKLDNTSIGANIDNLLISAEVLPATGIENQVCVITDKPVDRFIISPNLDVYNRDTNTILALTHIGDIEPVILNSNKVQQYYYFDKMYQGDVFKVSYIYKNNKWNVYTPAESALIKNNRIVNDAIFGGLHYRPGDEYTQKVELTSFGVELFFNTNTSYQYWGMCSVKVIDFSKFKTIEILYTNLMSHSSGFHVGIGDYYGLDDPDMYVGFGNNAYNVPYINRWVEAKVTSQTQSIKIDISSWTTKGFFVIFYSNQTSLQRITFHNIIMY